MPSGWCLTALRHQTDWGGVMDFTPELLLYRVRGSSPKMFQKYYIWAIRRLPDTCYHGDVDNAAGLKSPTFAQGGCVYEAHQCGSCAGSSYGSDDGTDSRPCSGEGHPAKT